MPPARDSRSRRGNPPGRRVVDTPPGSVARVELLRDGERRVVEIPVRELDTVPRV